MGIGFIVLVSTVCFGWIWLAFFPEIHAWRLPLQLVGATISVACWLFLLPLPLPLVLMLVLVLDAVWVEQGGGTVTVCDVCFVIGIASCVVEWLTSGSYIGTSSSSFALFFASGLALGLARGRCWASGSHSASVHLHFQFCLIVKSIQNP